MVLNGFGWFWKGLGGFGRVWEGLGRVGRGGEGWGGLCVTLQPAKVLFLPVFNIFLQVLQLIGRKSI